MFNGAADIELMSHDGRGMALFFVAASDPWHVIRYFFPFRGIENGFVDGHYCITNLKPAR